MAFCQKQNDIEQFKACDEVYATKWYSLKKL